MRKIPGKQIVTYFDGLQIEAKPKEYTGIYFTDQNPEFLLEVRNKTNKKIQGEIIWFYGFGSGIPQNWTQASLKVDLDPGQEAKGSMKVLLGFQGNGVIAVIPPKIKSETSNKIEIEPSSPCPYEYDNLYTFTILDREFYKRLYHRPTMLTKVLTILTGILIFLTVILVVQQFFLIKTF